MTELDARLVAYCGLYCGDCAGYGGEIATHAEALLGALAAYRFELSAAELFSEAIPDYARLEETIRFLAGTRCPRVCRERTAPDEAACVILRCCRERGLDGCWACGERAGCEHLRPMAKVHGDSLDRNLAAIAELGVAGWLATGRRYWFGSEVEGP
jgi:hypothetical protein